MFSFLLSQILGEHTTKPTNYQNYLLRTFNKAAIYTESK
jgi:hypothetical protein